MATNAQPLERHRGSRRRGSTPEAIEVAAVTGPRAEARSCSGEVIAEPTNYEDPASKSGPHPASKSGLLLATRKSDILSPKAGPGRSSGS
jgi:hypothetical protein